MSKKYLLIKEAAEITGMKSADITNLNRKSTGVRFRRDNSKKRNSLSVHIDDLKLYIESHPTRDTNIVWGEAIMFHPSYFKDFSDRFKSYPVMGYAHLYMLFIKTDVIKNEDVIPTDDDIIVMDLTTGTKILPQYYEDTGYTCFRLVGMDLKYHPTYRHKLVADACCPNNLFFRHDVHTHHIIPSIPQNDNPANLLPVTVKEHISQLHSFIEAKTNKIKEGKEEEYYQLVDKIRKENEQRYYYLPYSAVEPDVWGSDATHNFYVFDEEGYNIFRENGKLSAEQFKDHLKGSYFNDHIQGDI